MKVVTSEKATVLHKIESIFEFLIDLTCKRSPARADSTVPGRQREEKLNEALYSNDNAIIRDKTVI